MRSLSSLVVMLAAVVAASIVLPPLVAQRQIAERQVPVCNPAIEPYIHYKGDVGRWECLPTPPSGVFADLTLGGTLVARTGSQINLLSQGVAAGYKIARGETALDGSNPTTAATGLATIVACTATLKLSTAPGLSTSVLTYATSGATLSLYGWKPTSADDTTLIASDGTETAGWVCIGT